MQFDLSPLYKSSVGFDHFASLLEAIDGLDSVSNSYPPYNIERVGESDYRITLAVAGFDPDELNIDVNEGVLRIIGRKTDESEETHYLHKGIATRNFERRLQLADFIEVTGANVENGLLHVNLTREVPEALKPRTIEISNGKKAVKAKAKKTIDAKVN